MAARAYWQGQIRLALVSIPVEVYPATRSGPSISFHQVHEPSGKRIRYEKIEPGIGPVDRAEIVKGYEVSKGNYVLLDEEEIEAVKIESRKTLDLVQFVDAGEIDVLYYEKPYFVIPADDLAEEAYAVLRDALRQTKKVGLGHGLGQVTLGHGADDARDFGRRLHHVVDQLIEGVELGLPATGSATHEGAVADFAFLADHAGQALEFVGDALIEAYDFVEERRDLVVFILTLRQPHAEIAVPELAQSGDKFAPANAILRGSSVSIHFADPRERDIPA